MSSLAVRYVTIAAAFIAGAAITCAQQSAQWRPNIAEDNKAASYDDTVSFLNQWLSTTGHQDGWNGSEVLDATSPQRCVLHVSTRWYDHLSIHYVDTQLNLGAIDPLSIRNDDRNLYFAGSANAKFVHGSDTQWKAKDQIGPADARYVLEGTGPSCPVQAKKVRNLEWCSVHPIDSYEVTFRFDSQESARRYARALMHASLLCGGTKAISPF